MAYVIVIDTHNYLREYLYSRYVQFDTMGFYCSNL